MWGRLLLPAYLLGLLATVARCREGPWEDGAGYIPDSNRDVGRVMGSLLDPMPPQKTATAFSRFNSAVAAAGSLTFVTEMGDKTFFVAAMLATKYDKLPVFLGSTAALWLQTLGCALVGAMFHHLPSRTSGWMAWPLDDYVAAMLLFAFGIFHLKDGIWPGGEAEVDVVYDFESMTSPTADKLDQNKLEQGLMEKLIPPATAATSSATTPSSQAPAPRVSRRLSTSSSRVMAEASAELRRAGTLTRKSNRSIFLKAFGLVTAAEFGDRSMFSTVALAASQNPVGVFVGASMGHAVVTLMAVSCAVMLHQYMSERATNLLGGALFLMFGVLSLVEGLVRQGVMGDNYLAL